MTSFPPGPEAGHPSDEEILLFTDRELRGRKAKKIERHIDHCWSCRARVEQVRSAILGFVEYRDNVVRPLTPPPPEGWRGFDSGLRRAAVEVQYARPTTALPWFRVLALRQNIIFAALAAFVILFVVLRMKETAVVSADTLLERAALTEGGRGSNLTQTVVRQKLAVRVRNVADRRENSASIEIWDDRLHSEVRKTSSASTVTAQLDEMLRENHLDPAHPLSAGSFNKWRHSLESKHDEARSATLPDGEAAWEVRTSPKRNARSNAILTAMIVLRAADGHPVREELSVEGVDYEISETSFEVVDLASVAAAVHPTPPAIRPVPLQDDVQPEPSVEAIPGPAGELDVAEVAARVALHRLGADLGEPLEVVRSSDRQIEVRGMASSAERKRTLREALEPIPQVKIRITTPEEAAAAVALPAVSSATNAEVRPAILGGKPPVQPYLERLVADDPTKFSNRVLELSDQAMSRAWALKHLADRYPASEMALLPEPARAQVNELIRGHLRGLNERLAGSLQILTPVLRTLAEASPLAAGWDARWPDFCAPLFETVARADQMTSALFVAGASSEPPEQSARELLAALLTLSQELNKLEAPASGSPK